MNTSYKDKTEAAGEGGGLFLILGTLLVLTVGVSLLPASWFGVKPPERSYARLDLSSPNSISQVAPDADSDGTISWKEFVAGSLDIPVSGMSAQITDADLKSDPRALASLNDPNNLTSSFSKNLYIASTVLQKNGITDPVNEQETINQLLKEEVIKIQPVTYTEENVKIGKEDTAAALKIYGNAVATILKSMISQQSVVDDLSSLSLFTESNDEADLAPIFVNKKKAGEALQKLLNLPVPKSAVSMHVTMLNSVGTFANTLKDLSAAFDDPIRSTVALKHYMEDAGRVLNNFPKFGVFFKNKNITFSNKEAGYLFMVGYTGK